MTQPRTLEQLTALAPSLRSAGLAALYLFGSTARDEAAGASDIDLLFDADEGGRFSLLDQAKLQLGLSEALGRRVDLIERAALRPAMRARVESEMIRVY